MNQDQVISLNHNTAECIKSALRLTETFYQNICNGASYSVPYGAMDYILGGLVGAFLLAVIAIFLGMALSIIFDSI